jgi:hypothetical protein
MKLTPSDISRQRLANWIESARPIATHPTWIEKRQAIDFGGHTYVVSNGQVFQCAHCGHFDPKWNATEVLTYFKDNFGIKPYDIEVTCSVAIPSEFS